MSWRRERNHNFDSLRAKRCRGSFGGFGFAHRKQRRFHDFNVWSHKKRIEKLEYMHLNPVKNKLVSHPKEWAWSSYSHYARGEEGLVAIDDVQ